jgi:exosome complex exonuclease DIS3/RRP44
MLRSTSSPPNLVLLTDDRRNRELAAADGIVGVSARAYVDGLEAGVREGVVDLVVGGVDEAQGEKRGRRVYDEVGDDPTLLILG